MRVAFPAKHKQMEQNRTQDVFGDFNGSVPTGNFFSNSADKQSSTKKARSNAMRLIKVAVKNEVSALALALLAGADHYQNFKQQVAVLPKGCYWEAMATDIGAWLEPYLAARAK